MTKIEWTDKTWNPVVGCSKISEGCDNCYAEKMATRLKAMKINGYQHVIGDCFPCWTGETVFIESALEKPFKWKKPCRIFVCSMGDLFHPTVTDSQLNSIFLTMVKADWHTYLLLTKRPERMLEAMSMGWRGQTKNIWIGVTVENQQSADERIPILLKTPATIRFVSVEPMLGEIDLYWALQTVHRPNERCVDWVICGGETGPGARPMRAGWAIALRDQCKSEGVPFFFKKYGTWWCKKQGISPKNIENRQLGGELIEEYPQAGTEAMRETINDRTQTF